VSQYHLSIYRHDPSVEGSGRYVDYTLSTGARLKVLDALDAVSKEYDTGIAYRASCLMGRCGSCAVMLNGKPVLACQAQVEPGDSKIEPLRGYPVVRDLLVDRTPHERILTSVRAHLDASGFARPAAFTYGKDLYSLTLCTECLVCQASCPARNEVPADFAGPAVMTQLARYARDPRDQGSRPVTALMEGLHSCTSCMTCSEVCPKGIDVFGQAILALRKGAANTRLPSPKVQDDMTEMFRQTRLALPKSGPLLVEELDNAGCAHGDVAVFLGCMFQVRHKEDGRALLDVLRNRGYSPVVPKGLVCCGGPLLWTGHEEEARQAAVENVKILNETGASKVITACAGCGLAWNREYPRLLEGTGLSPRFQVLDVSRVLAAGKRPEEGAVVASGTGRCAYFLPCHIRSQGAADDARRAAEMAIASSGGTYVAVEFPECCGGMSASADPQLASRLAAKVIAAAERDAIDTIVTSCPFCVENLARGARRARSKVRITHLLGISK